MSATAARGTQVLAGLAALVEGAHSSDDYRLEQAAIRWSQRVRSTGEVVSLAGEIRAGAPLTREREAVLQRVTVAAVSAVSEREMRSALTDPLTGLATRARMEEGALHLVAVSLREKRPLTAVVLDVDGLKRINDEQGHAAGDAALAAVGRAIRQHVRRTDCAYRWGGDEFVILMPSTTEQGAQLVIERIQEAAGTPTTAGVALHRGGSDAVDVATWLSEADADLYRTRRRVRGDGPALPVPRKHVGRHLPRSLAVALAVAAAGVGGVAATTAASSLGLDGTPLRTLGAAPSQGSGAVTPDAPTDRVGTPDAPARVTPTVVKPAVGRVVHAPAVPTVPRVQVPDLPKPVPPAVVPTAPPPVVTPEDITPGELEPTGLVQQLLNGVGVVVGRVF
jgi:diguanylate cyclase (GGDEF)-like protein